MRSENKVVLVIIIILLVISVPASIWGITYKILDATKKEVVEAPVIKDFYEDGQLNFYDFGTLVGTYTCENNVYCGWAYETMDDVDYDLDYYFDKTIDTFNLVNGRYAFIVDTSVKEEYYRSSWIKLYDVTTSSIIDEYVAVKNYTIGMENDTYIVKNGAGKWGVIQLGVAGMDTVVPFEYDYIGVQNQLANASSLLVADKFAAIKDGSWVIVDATGSELSFKISQDIYQYDNGALIVKDEEGKFKLYDYDGNTLLNGVAYKDLKFVNKYVFTFDFYGYFKIADYTTGTIVSTKNPTISSLGDVTYEVNEDGSMDIYISGAFTETVK